MSGHVTRSDHSFVFRYSEVSDYKGSRKKYYLAVIDWVIHNEAVLGSLKFV